LFNNIKNSTIMTSCSIFAAFQLKTTRKKAASLLPLCVQRQEIGILRLTLGGDKSAQRLMSQRVELFHVQNS
jgi:hypothetical protein